MTINFKCTERERELIGKIADRAVKMAREVGTTYRKQDAMMDITACHCNGCPLKLEELLNADGFNFAHDVFGIRRHLNRITGELDNLFLPRFHEKEVVT